MIFDLIRIAAQVGLLYVPLILGIYLAMGVLSLPDLTLQGSFGLGGSLSAVLLVNGAPPVLSVLGGMALGSIAGLITATLHLKLRMNVLLASILVATASYSGCLIVMGSGNISLAGHATAFSWASDLGLNNQWATILAGALIALLVSGLLLWFLRTDYGMSLVASGQNIQTARGLGIRTENRQLVGLMIANALAACSGALVVHNQGFMDVTIQTTVIVIGLAGMMIGLALVRSGRVAPTILALIGGALIYRFAVATTLQLGLNPNLLQLITAALVILVIWARYNSRSVLSLFSPNVRRERRQLQARYYEEDRVASFI